MIRGVLTVELQEKFMYLRDVSKFINLAKNNMKSPSSTSIHDEIVLECRVNLLRFPYNQRLLITSSTLTSSKIFEVMCTVYSKVISSFPGLFSLYIIFTVRCISQSTSKDLDKYKIKIKQQKSFKLQCQQWFQLRKEVQRDRRQKRRVKPDLSRLLSLTIYKSDLFHIIQKVLSDCIFLTR